jgi:hypothetical protein
MKLKGALFAAATAGAFLLLAACGGDGGQSQPDPVSAGGTSPLYVAIDLTPSGYIGAWGTGIGGSVQVGGTTLWRGSASNFVNLTPNGFSVEVLGTDGTTQVGYGHLLGTDGEHALKWSGSADSVVILDSNSFESQARGVAGEQIVGYGYGHALLWTGGGVVDLNPIGFVGSLANATDGRQQVGKGITGNAGHALLWSGTAESTIDLHPAGYQMSEAFGVSKGQQVGWGMNSSGYWRALLWTGSSGSVVDLTPPGFGHSSATGVAAGRQVGGGMIAGGGGLTHALLWNGTADSVVDLHMFLPAGFSGSAALGIDASGNVVGWATTATAMRAILWVRQ